MAATLTIVNQGNPNLIEPVGGQFVSELVKITGVSTAAADTGTYTTGGLVSITGVEGGCFTASLSGTTVTITSIYALGSNTVLVRVVGKKTLA